MMKESYPIEKTCCFTGHRPERLPWQRNESHSLCDNLKKNMMRNIFRLADRGVVRFICGMALGTDTYFGEAVVAVQTYRPQIILEAARPCATQSSRWSAQDKERYEKLLNQCNIETLLQHDYTSQCMMNRNKYMVNQSAVVISAFDGRPRGGTYRTIQYAEKLGREHIPLSLTDGEF